MADKLTPTFTELEAFSLGNDANKKRYDTLITNFEEQFKLQPHYVVRAPGRVNLIGEHIDYCGYGVLPMALSQDVAMALAIDEDSSNMVLVNTEASYQPNEVTVNLNDFSIEGTQWYEYILCGIKGVMEEKGLEKSKGVKILLNGNIPPSAGLSSSSALVCCAALMTTVVNGLNISKSKLADICAKCERYIGTQGGGMDQAISFLAEEGQAKYIQFDPLRTTNVPLPLGATFVVANTLKQANKAATAHFNERVVECRLAAKVIIKAKGKDWSECRTLGQAQNILECQLEDMDQVVKDVLHEAAYSKSELCELFQISEEELLEMCMSKNTHHMQTFKLYQRALHVYQEALNVIQFHRAATSGGSPEAVLRELGRLMNASHKSCNTLYECSSAELNQMVEVCLEKGAYGSRMTGAGWGGCTVSLIPQSSVELFVKDLKECSYYTGDPDRKAQVDSAVFASPPGGGVAILTFSL